MKANHSSKNKPPVGAMLIQEQQLIYQLLCTQMQAALKHLEQFNTQVMKITKTLALTHEAMGFSRLTKNNISLH